MPIYEFECRQCSRITEQIHKVACDVRSDFMWCINCQKSLLHTRVISKCSFHLKGGGWAKDGYIDPKAGMPGKGLTGQRWLENYRKRVRDPEHPYKVGDHLKRIRRKGDDLSDIGDPDRDLDADRNAKRVTSD